METEHRVRLSGSASLETTAEATAMIQVFISFVDGSAQEMEEDDAFYHRCSELRNRVLEGKSLIDTLITDDWGPPPKYVRLSGALSDGTAIKEESISYR